MGEPLPGHRLGSRPSIRAVPVTDPAEQAELDAQRRGVNANRGSYPDAAADSQEQVTVLPSPPIILGNRYYIIRELGKGGMGEVLEAKDRNVFGRRVAVKKILRSGAGPNGSVRFDDEIKALATLQHPHIVTVIDRGEDNENHPYFVMEYLEGGSLASQLSKGRLPWREAAEYIRQALKGLAYMHGSNFLHRDLKPANLLLAADRQTVKLSDFGLSRSEENPRRLTQSGQGMGTLGYIAPEQWEGKAERRSDLFSLTATFYALLAGKDPPSSYRELPKVEGLPEEIRERLHSLLRKGTAQNPGDRYQTAEEYLKAIDELLGTPIRPEDPPPVLFLISGAMARQEQERWQHFLKLPEPTWTNSRQIRFQLVPPGRFWMGLQGGPGREVTIPHALWAAEFPITNRAFREFLTAQGLASYGRGPDDAPAVNLSVHDVTAFCAWLGKDGHIYRLPTEAEWEYLARAGCSGVVWWPANANPRDCAVFDTTEPAVADPTRANALGLIDVLGNVCEWTSSAYRLELTEEAERPAAQAESGRVIRGGCYRDRRLEDLRFEARNVLSPSTRLPILGARLVRELAPR